MSVEPRYRRIFIYDANDNIIDSSNPLPVEVSNIWGMIDFNYDYVVETEPNTSTEVYTFYNGAGDATGTLMATITVVYFDSTKARFVSASKVIP